MLFLLVSHPLLAQSEKKSPYIFQIQCDSGDKVESQTGFSVADGKGIVTALHGVVKCLNGGISAVAKGGGENMFDLRIESADIANDVALLSSANQQISKGLPIAKCDSNSCINYEKQYYVLGHPLGIIPQMPTKVSIRPIFEPLGNWLMAAVPEVTTEKVKTVKKEKVKTVMDKMKERGSPAITIQVFNVEGHLLHGHSGAPIINEKDEVIGVVDGGLKDGTVEIAWAIPYKNLQLKKVSEIASELTVLKSKSILGLFAFSESSSSDVLNLKILLANSTQASPTMENAISQAVFKDRSASYFLPISQGNSLENVQQVVIGTDNEVLAHGKLNTLLSSPDGQYQFVVSNKDGIWVLSLKLCSLLPSTCINFPIGGEREDPVGKVIGGHMKTIFSLDSEGNLSATTRWWTNSEWQGFTGIVYIVLLAKNNNPLWVSQQYRHGVDGNLIGESSRSESWTEKVPANILAKVGGYAISHENAPRTLLWDWVTSENGQQRIREISQILTAIPR